IQEKLIPKSYDYGIALLNYSEVLAYKLYLNEAITIAKKATRIIRENYGNDVFTASSLSNMAGILCSSGNYEEAKKYCKEALDIFIEKLGKDNDYTKNCWSNYYYILKTLEHNDEIKELETSWKTDNVSDITIDD